MLTIYDSLTKHDEAALSRYALTREILMENAARGVYSFLCERHLDEKNILIITGSGDNGADGAALARMLPHATLFCAVTPMSPLCLLQHERAKKLDIPYTDHIDGYDVIIDAILGSGARRALSGELLSLIEKINVCDAYKIALDVPSGLYAKFAAHETAFQADVTVTMGALKTVLYGDYAKEYVGEIRIADLGLSAEKYQHGFAPNALLLEKDDIKTPKRYKKNVHKGDFGHLAIVCGEMPGASIIAAQAAVRFGAGLVSIIGNTPLTLPIPLMQKTTVPENATCVLVGQGLGNALEDTYIENIVSHAKTALIDADLFSRPCIQKLLTCQTELVLTPHPKEFSHLLEHALHLRVPIETIQQERFSYAKSFAASYPNSVLVLKGANTIIVHKQHMFVVDIGTSALAKGGSGDVLDGLIASLLAQGYTPLEAAKNGVLAHALLAKNYKGNDFSLCAQDLIEAIQWLS